MNLKTIITISLSIFLSGCISTSKSTSPPKAEATANSPELNIIGSFTKAKKLATEIYSERPIAFYSSCDYYEVGGILTPVHSSCGYVTRSDTTRSKRIEWEHVVSMWELAHELDCWKEGGRENCSSDDKFKQMETDLQNLVPTIGEVNNDRSNFEHSIIENEDRVYGQYVDIEVDFTNRLFEPRPEVRGDIARIYFCMQKKYGLEYSDERTRLYYGWKESDPVDSWEKIRSEKINEIQGGICTEEGYSIPTVVAPIRVTPTPVISSPFSCSSEKQYCSHMSSCSEAKYYLNSCGRTRMDGDNDGTPCEFNLCTD